MRYDYGKPVLNIPKATPNEKDAAQYMLRHGKVQYNLCGQFCVAFCAQDNTHTNSIEDYLDYWEMKDPKWFKKSIFPNNQSRLTGIYDIEKYLQAYDYEMPAEKFSNIFMFSYSIGLKLDYHQAIVVVQIDHTGYLVGKGKPHWVVLDDIQIMDNNHAIVTIYNPFTNHMEPYSWREFMNSTGSYKNGIWVLR